MAKARATARAIFDDMVILLSVFESHQRLLERRSGNTIFISALAIGLDRRDAHVCAPSDCRVHIEVNGSAICPVGR
jgi:hypothetical protein